MKASLNWLKELVDLEGLSVEEIASKLTFAGLEVEGITPLASASGLVIGQIKEVKMHEDSDHLHVLQVDLGPKYGVKQIVCGAPNVKEGLKVIVCLPGAVLPGGTIKEGVIRGVSSYGMCASLVELGVDKKTLTPKQLEGIEELSDDAKVGEEKVLEYLGLDDVSLEISILPNRPDGLSLRGLALELSTIFNRPLKGMPEGV